MISNSPQYRSKENSDPLSRFSQDCGDAILTGQTQPSMSFVTA